MYIGGSCQGLGIGIKVSGVLVGLSVIDPDEGCCITRRTFLLTYIIPRAGDKLKRPTKKYFHVFSFDDTEEKVVVRFQCKWVKMEFSRQHCVSTLTPKMSGP